MASYSRQHTELMAGKGLHNSLLAAQLFYYYLVPKLPDAGSQPGAEPSPGLSCLSVRLAGIPSSRLGWAGMGSTLAIILPTLWVCGLGFRPREEHGPAQVKQRGGHGGIPSQAPTSCRISRPGGGGSIFPHSPFPPSLPSSASLFTPHSPSGHLTPMGTCPAPGTWEG